MFSINKTVHISAAFLLLVITKCASELPPLSLQLYSPGEIEYTEVIVKRVHDNLTLVCELRGDTKQHRYVWNYLPLSEEGEEHDQLQISPSLSQNSILTKPDLQLSDSGQYICSAPPFSVTKNILVQTRGPSHCARGAFWCGVRCVLAAYVCDGRPDCVAGEDEAPALCGHAPCQGPDKLNCSDGRCIPSRACCRPGAPLCQQPRCCDTQPLLYRDGVESEYPALFEDRHAPDDYGFIQSTIYTVTACALIFMIAVVLLVSAICKMHMKRAALRSHARRTYQVQAHRFPPCYEASRLLDREGRVSNNNSPAHTPASPQHGTQQSLSDSCGEQTPTVPERDSDSFALSRLSAMFTSRYRQVPTHPPDVELQNVHSASLNSSPTRNRTQTRLEHYRSPTFTDFEFYPTSENESFGRDLNYMATPVEFFRRRTLNRGLDRILDQIDRPRPLTLQLGRFQLSIPRFGRRSSTDLDRRPDTPNIAEINIDDLDFVRLNGNDTYTLNGRTIRLLGANFENYPTVGTSRPPPYNEAMRYKLYGPPPEYLSRDTLSTDTQAQNNVEMPPRYEEVGSGREIGENSNQIASDSLRNSLTGNSSNNAINSCGASNSNAEICVTNQNGNEMASNFSQQDDNLGLNNQATSDSNVDGNSYQTARNSYVDLSQDAQNSNVIAQSLSQAALNYIESNSCEENLNSTENQNSCVQNNSSNIVLDNSVRSNTDPNSCHNSLPISILCAENSNNNNGNNSCPDNGNVTELENNNVSITDIIDNLPAIDDNDNAIAV